MHCNHLFVLLRQHFVAHEHGDIRLDYIPHHIADLQHGGVDVVNSDPFAIIQHTDKQRSALAVRKSDHFVFDVFHHDRLKLNGFTFLQGHRPSPPVFLIIV